jgi:hypothetical protein
MPTRTDKEEALAHLTEDGRRHRLRDHLQGVGDLVHKPAIPFGLPCSVRRQSPPPRSGGG